MDLIKLYLAILLTFFLPGFFLMLAVFANHLKKITALEKLTVTFILSLFSIDFLILLLNFFNIPIFRKWILLSIVIFSVLCWLVYRLQARTRQLDNWTTRQLDSGTTGQRDNRTAGRPESYREIIILIIILIIIISVRGFYVSRGIMPQTTDLGHHIYWANEIVATGQLPTYGEPDFIIGEHLIFATIASLTRIPFVSALPVVILFIINIFSLLAIYILTYRLAFALVENLPGSPWKKEKKNPSLAKGRLGGFFINKPTLPRNIALLAFLIAGAFYGISSPGAKFVSGGVVGNVIGNLLIPFIFWALIQILQTRQWRFGWLFIAGAMTLVYTHHLSAFIFLYVFPGFLLLTTILFLVNYRLNLVKFFQILWHHSEPFLAGPNLLLLVIFSLFIFVIWEPSYLNRQAFDTAVGTPFKSTRTGWNLGQVIATAGPWRFLYGSIGFLLVGSLTFFSSKKNQKFFALALLAAWVGMIFLMTTQPACLKVDIPTNRIANYITLPLSVLSAFFVAFLIMTAYRKISFPLATVVFLTLLGTGFVSGFSDISESARSKIAEDNQAIMQTYLATAYLAQNTSPQEQIIKDHINLPGDTWMKIFFQRGYNYPLSRTYNRRYEDPTKERETCTRDMVAIPDSEIGQQCFDQTGTHYVVLKPGFDTAQFEKSANFQKVYVSDSVVIYQRL